MNNSGPIAESELIINPDGGIYHLHLKPHELAETIITVGDPNRVESVSRFFDTIQHKVQHREFVTHTGYLNNKRLSVISTGIGTDNIDIVFNELDALVNIDFATRTAKSELTALNIIRVGTSGSVQEDIEVDTILISEAAIGMDGLLNYYSYENTIQETVYLEAFTNYIKPWLKNSTPYIASAGDTLLQKFESHYAKGTTITANGFYAPQGRMLRLKQEYPGFIEAINKFRHKHFRITNLEMETAGIYGLGKLMGHQCLSVNAILANRARHKFSSDPNRVVTKMIEEVLEIATS
ncbi:MAG TPA: nucleoside phosphorylase [Chitinophagales bacterium]|nr:nucleoside phosphorylase [Chitinophagales bacterium]